MGKSQSKTRQVLFEKIKCLVGKYTKMLTIKCYLWKWNYKDGLVCSDLVFLLFQLSVFSAVLQTLFLN